MNSASMMKIIAIVLLIAGAGLTFWGYQLSGGFGSQLSQTVTGSATDAVMMRYIAGAAFFAVGLFLFVKK